MIYNMCGMVPPINSMSLTCFLLYKEERPIKSSVLIIEASLAWLLAAATNVYQYGKEGVQYIKGEIFCFLFYLLCLFYELATYQI